ncbi:hypothetical protein D3C87_406370 [compost metagenome]
MAYERYVLSVVYSLERNGVATFARMHNVCTNCGKFCGISVRIMRSINVIWDEVDKKAFKASRKIRSQRMGFELRSYYQENPARFECLECGQKLVVANSSHGNIYFRHFANTSYCFLKDESVDAQLIEDHSQYLYDRESDRHRELKNRIGNSLGKVNGVAFDSIIIDSKYLVREGEKRKPDVYCTFWEENWFLRSSFLLCPLDLLRIVYNFIGSTMSMWSGFWILREILIFSTTCNVI